MFQKILVAVDLVEEGNSRKALATATELARHFGAALQVIYVRHVMDLAVDYLPPDVVEREERDAIARLKAMTSGIGIADDRLSFAAPLGNIAEGVLSAADDFGADLIVVGAHRPSMAKFLLGSNATKVTRHAKASVLIVREDGRAAGAEELT